MPGMQLGPHVRTSEDWRVHVFISMWFVPRGVTTVGLMRNSLLPPHVGSSREPVRCGHLGP